MKLVFKSNETEKCSNYAAGATEKSLGRRKHHAKIVTWSYDMEGHAKNTLQAVVR